MNDPNQKGQSIFNSLKTMHRVLALLVVFASLGAGGVGYVLTGQTYKTQNESLKSELAEARVDAANAKTDAAAAKNDLKALQQQKELCSQKLAEETPIANAFPELKQDYATCASRLNSELAINGMAATVEKLRKEEDDINQEILNGHVDGDIFGARNDAEHAEELKALNGQSAEVHEEVLRAMSCQSQGSVMQTATQ